MVGRTEKRVKVYMVLWELMLCKECRNSLNNQVSVYPAGQSEPKMPARYLFTVSERG